MLEVHGFNALGISWLNNCGGGGGGGKEERVGKKGKKSQP